MHDIDSISIFYILFHTVVRVCSNLHFLIFGVTWYPTIMVHSISTLPTLHCSFLLNSSNVFLNSLFSHIHCYHPRGLISAIFPPPNPRSIFYFLFFFFFAYPTPSRLLFCIPIARFSSVFHYSSTYLFFLRVSTPSNFLHSSRSLPLSRTSSPNASRSVSHLELPIRARSTRPSLVLNYRYVAVAITRDTDNNTCHRVSAPRKLYVSGKINDARDGRVSGTRYRLCECVPTRLFPTISSLLSLLRSPEITIHYPPRFQTIPILASVLRFNDTVRFPCSRLVSSQF